MTGPVNDLSVALEALGRHHAESAAVRNPDGTPSEESFESLFVEAARTLRLDQFELEQAVESYRVGWDQAAAGMTLRTQPDLSRYGKRLRDLIDNSGMSVAQVCAAVGVPRTYAYKIFKGEINTTVNMLQRFLEVVGASWSDLN